MGPSKYHVPQDLCLLRLRLSALLPGSEEVPAMLKTWVLTLSTQRALC